jgi:hypothetical protein
MGEHQYVIFSDPLDYPGQFVVRRFYFVGGKALPELQPVGVKNTLEEARQLIPETHGYMISRLPQDEKQIVEVWMPDALGEHVKQVMDELK